MIKRFFPEAELSLKLTSVVEPGYEKGLELTIGVTGNKNEVQKNFRRLKSEWWFGIDDSILELVSISIEHPEFSTQQAIQGLGGLIGSLEALEDWALEHDHYLYGTPKRFQTQNNG